MTSFEIENIYFKLMFHNVTVNDYFIFDCINASMVMHPEETSYCPELSPHTKAFLPSII